ncbi:MAG: long-chain fatty acid--CoA ligase [Proteobacteria bacterium]|nr:long-chain fatty acid--CoA ligase [Pseudomonadota bacterium]
MTAAAASPAGGGAVRVVTDAAIGESLASMLLHRTATKPEGVILRKKDRGIWNQITWRELETRARHVGMGLAAAGVAPGDRVAVLAETGTEWAYADLGILGAGGVSVGIYPTSAPAQVAYVLRDSGAVVLFVENEEQLDKALEARAECPDLRQIVIFDMTGLRELDDPMCESFEAFMARGAAHDAAHPGAWQSGVAAIRGGDLAILVYTSGTTGQPKGAMLDHRCILFQIVNGTAVLGQREGDERLAFLPMCHVAERIAGFYQALYSGTVSNYAEGSDTVLENLREVQPTVQGGVPRFWERFHSRTTIAVHDATWMQKLAYRWAMAVGARRAEARLAGRGPSAGTSLLFRLAYWLVLRNIRREIGIDRLRWGFIGAAPSAPELIRWYLSLGVDLLEVYGMTECGGIATAMPADAIRLGTVGKPVPYGEIAVSPQGEILMRGGHVFRGYWNLPEQTAQALRDGWLHTGDVGAIDAEGYLRVTDRMKDIIITSGGKNVTPSEIESALKFSAYIADAVVIGDGRNYLTCLVMIDHENVEKWAQDNSVPFTSFTSLARSDAVRGLIEKEIARVNELFARVEQIKTFRLIEQKLEAEDPELTPTMKLRRAYVNKKYAELIETMYVGT